MRTSFLSAAAVFILLLLQGGSSLHQQDVGGISPLEETSSSIFRYGGPITGEVLHVGGVGPDNLTTIQDAVNRSSEGGWIMVHEGSYDEAVLVNRSVNLLGNGTVVLDGSGLGEEHLLEVTANNVSIRGFNITGGKVPVLVNASGFMIENNTFFENEVDLFWYYNRTRLRDDHIVHDSTLRNNTIRKSISGSYHSSFLLRVKLHYIEPGYNTTLGNITISQNTFNMTGSEARSVEMCGWLQVFGNHGGKFRMEDIRIDNNTFIEGDMGVWLYNRFMFLPEMDLKTGDIMIDDNSFIDQDHKCAIVSPPIMNNNFGSASLTSGEIFVRNNLMSVKPIIYWSSPLEVFISTYDTAEKNTTSRIDKVKITGNSMEVKESYHCGASGILLRMDGITSRSTENSSFVFEGYEITDNRLVGNCTAVTIEVVNTGCDLSENASVHLGPVVIHENHIDSDRGISSVFYRMGNNLSGSSKFSFEGLRISKNTVTSRGKGIDIIFNETGTELSGSSSFNLSSVRVCSNEVVSADTGITLNISSCGSNMINGSKVSMGNLDISGNSIRTQATGIRSGIGPFIGYMNGDRTRTTMEGILYENNRIEAGLDGLLLKGPGYTGHMLSVDAVFEMGEISLSGNEIDSQGGGIRIAGPEALNSVLRDNSRGEFDGFSIDNNDVDSVLSAVQFDGLNEVMMYLNGNASSRTGLFSIRDNTLSSSSGSGVGIEGEYMATSLGCNSSCSWEGLNVSGNMIEVSENGIDISIKKLSHGISDLSRATIGDMIFLEDRMNSLGGLSVDLGTSKAMNDTNFSLGSIKVRHCSFNVYGTALSLKREVLSAHDSRVSVSPFLVSDNEMRSSGGGYGVSLASRVYNSSSSEPQISDHLVNFNVIGGFATALHINTTSTAYVYLNDLYGNELDGGSASGNTVFNSKEPMEYRFLQTNLKSRLGNHWEGHEGPDADLNGIVDVKYDLLGGADNYPLRFNRTEHYPPLNDTTPPSIDIATPNGMVFTEENITIEWTASDPGVGISHFLLVLDNGEELENGRATFIELEELADGRHTLSITAVDFIGNRRTITIEFWIDTTWPEAVLISPANDIILSPDDLPLMVLYSSSDSGAGIENLSYRVDEGPIHLLDPEGGEVQHPDPLSDGYHSIRMTTVDRGGHTSLVSATFALDTTAPSVNFTSVPEGSYLNDEFVEIKWTSKDGISGVSAHKIRIDGGDWSDLGLSTNVTYFGLEEGLHTIQLITSDRVGNSISLRLNFTVDRTLPEVAIEGITDGEHTSDIYPDIRMAVDGTGSEIVNLTILLDGREMVLDEGWVHAGPLDEGFHILEISVKDSAGNIFERTLSFFVDTLAPDLIESFPEGEGVSTSPEIGMRFNEDLSRAEPVMISPFVGGEIRIAKNLLRFTPSSDLSTSTQYVLHFKVFDLAGNSDEFLMRFKTSDHASGFGGSEGLVVDGDGDPIPDVDVRYEGLSKGKTDLNGRFLVELPHGTRRVELTREGYRTIHVDLEVADGKLTDAGTIVMEDKEEDEALDLRMIVSLFAILLAVVSVGSFVLYRRTRPEEPEAVFLIEGEDYFDEEFE